MQSRAVDATDVHAGALAHGVEAFEDGDVLGGVGFGVGGGHGWVRWGRYNAGVNSRQVIRRLEKEGWRCVRICGSHHVFKHPDRPAARVVVPHPRKDFARGTWLNIMKQAGWSER
ncbi:MAG: type II toxin-antitoxin system HicA family toxin [Phycisphaeraceae bacterium]